MINRDSKITRYFVVSLIIIVPIWVFISDLWSHNWRITTWTFFGIPAAISATVLFVIFLLRHPDPKTLEQTPIFVSNECLTCNHDLTKHDNKTKSCMYNTHDKLYHSMCGCTKFIPKMSTDH